MSAPRSSARRAAPARISGSRPASCTARRPSSASRSDILNVLRCARTTALLASISVTTSSAPNFLTMRRNGLSVTPDIGARITPLSKVSLPSRIGCNRAPPSVIYAGLSSMGRNLASVRGLRQQVSRETASTSSPVRRREYGPSEQRSRPRSWCNPAVTSRSLIAFLMAPIPYVSRMVPSRRLN